MKTVDLDADQMRRRIARYADIPDGNRACSPLVPQAARDLIYAGERRTVAIPAELSGPLDNRASIVGTDFALVFAVCPPGQGPGLHAHLRTTETFTCLRGRFRVYWGDAGQHETVLEELDTISVPPGVNRGFQNVGAQEGILQALVTGPVGDMDDIQLAPGVVAELEAFGPEVVAELRKTGLTFATES